MPADLDIVGSAGVDVVPVVPNFHNRLKAAVLPAADRVGEEAGRRMGDAISRHITISIPDAINTGGRNARVAAARQGDNTGGAFARSLRAKLEQAFRSMPKLDVRLGDTGVDAELARIRAKLEQLSNKRIGIDVSAEAARAEVGRLEEQLRRLGAAHPNVAVRADTAAARAALAEFRAEIDAVTADPARIRIETDGSFGAKLRAAVRQAEASLPNININADSTPAQVEIARLRQELTTLRDARVGIDIDAATALARITEIQGRLARLSASDADVAVRVDAGAAEAQLAVVHSMVNRLDRDDVHIRIWVDSAAAQAALFQLAISLGAVAAIPILPIAAAGIGAIASAAVAAGAGVGALALAAIPAIKGVTSAIRAKTAADKEAATATNNSAAASVRAAQNALQMANAQQALTAAHRNAARSIAQANRQVEDAERALGQAAARAMEQREQAAEAVERAERSLADAKRQSTDAERALTQARKDAVEQLAEYNDRLAAGKLDQKDAALRVQEAQEELNRVLADPTATDLQMERAQLAYEQARQAQREQTKQYKQLQDEAKKAKEAGVDGNEDVRKATDDVKDAQQNVRDQTEALAKAHKDAAKAEVEAAQQVADAQRALSDAVQNAADTQVQAADSIASAERGVESARLSSIDTTTSATSKADAYREALAKLTPEQRDLYDSIAGPKGLTAAYKDWSKSVQPDVLPLFTRGVDGAKNSLPGLTPLVQNAADAVRELMDRASAQLKTPFWRGFKKDIEESAKPAIVGLGVAFGNVFKGMAGIVDAFLPHMDGISDRMQTITGRFADWGTGLKDSDAFQGFLRYVQEHGPEVADTLGKLGGAFFDVAHALEPFTGPILEMLGDAAEMISWIAENAPWSIQLLYGLWIATRLWNLAVAMSPVGRIILLLIGLGLALKYAWDHSETFRDIVTGAWSGISSAAKTAWDDYLKPTVDAVTAGFQGIADIAVGLWKDFFVPAWDGMVTVAKYAVAIILTLVIAPLVIAIQGIGLILGWLWTDCFKPTWDAISGAAQLIWENALWPFFQAFWDAIKWVGDKFSDLYYVVIAPIAGLISLAVGGLWDDYLWPFFKSFWGAIKWVGDKFQSLYDDYVDPVVDAIAEAAGWLYRKGLKPAFDNIKSAIGLVGDAFGDAKDAIKEAWNQVVDITKRPVNFVIDAVYTHGIKAVWDRVAKFVGLDPLPKAPKLLAAGGTVGDGWGIARPMKTNRPTAIVGEGNPRYPEYVIPTDPKYRGRAKALHAAAGTQLLESGGVIGGAWDWTRDVFGGIGDWATIGLELMGNPGAVWDRLIKPTLDHAADGTGHNRMGSMLTRVPKKMSAALREMLVNAATLGFGGGGGGVGQWVKPVNVPYGTRFGVAGPMWSSGHHTGLDFPASVGTPVHAVDGGTVIGVGTAGPYGNHIEIDHGGKLVSLYAHMSKLLAGLGQVVGQGDVIGQVGATGNVTGPHLHLEARVNGKAVDPMPYLESIRTGGKVSQSIAAAKNFAKSQLKYFGWGVGEWPSLDRLWTGESGWRWNAKNPSSGAYGIPQALPAEKMASAGPDWRTNAATQIQWGMGYIKNRPDYGSPSAAYGKWLGRFPHWYDDGGYLPPGLSLVANGTGSPEPVFTGSQWADIRAAKSGGGATTIQADVKVYVGDREITDIVRTEITTYDSAVASDLNNGRWV
ncbi:peptidoglycan DD-metalloendopeptidase family protein [Streptomyces cinerochromogenes]|uniref:Peptidoglycan DD-metalloendopeptidase family protein n=1 Tax=Streptomyces cinerochromogenes TaxID=66422 RepID=A0ABW7BBW7_9ACTN